MKFSNLKISAEVKMLMWNSKFPLTEKRKLLNKSAVEETKNKYKKGLIPK
jgi:hypothetical protein